MSTPLSPAAQAVWTAAWEDCPIQCGDIAGTRRKQLAAAIRAVADQVNQMRPHGGRAWTVEQATANEALNKGAEHILAIADELEGQP